MRRLKAFNALVAADPTDAQSEIRISEIQRRQGHYDEALATLEKAKLQVQDSLELSYNEALIYDALGKYGQATDVLTGILDSSAHADGKYSEQEKQNRAIFLDRLGIIDREENKTAEAVAAYKQIIEPRRRVRGTRLRRRDRCLSRRAPVEGSNRGRRRSGEGAAQEPPRSNWPTPCSLRTPGRRWRESRWPRRS